MKRSTVLVLVIAGVVAAAGLGWLAGSRIKSPAEVAAEAAPPAASNITVDVVETELSADIVTRGDIAYDEPVTLELSGSFADSPEALVVTRAHTEGTELAEGDLAVEIVGRPVFVLAGELPMFRDLRPGATGDDVKQLEEALARMGFFEGTPDERWDSDTGAAVSAWYADQGFLPNGVSAEEEETLRGARDRVRGAQGMVADAQQSLKDAQAGAGQAAITAARAEVTRAKNDLELVKLDAERANGLAAAAVTESEAALTGARDALTAAEADLVAAEDALANATEADRTAAQEAVDAARAALDAAVVVVDDAETVLDDAQFARTRTTKEQAAMVTSATDSVKVAEANLAELQKGVDTAAIRRQIASAQEELGIAQEDLAELQSKLGTWLPAGEVVYVSRLPVRINQVAAERGDTVTGGFLVVSGSELTLRSSVAERDAPRVEPGMAVRIENPNTGDFIDGEITAVADRPGTNNLGADRVFIEMEPEDLPTEMIGMNVRIVIPVSSTGGSVLAVPNAALSATADGNAILQVENDDETLRTVRVEPGLSAGGLVEVTPVEGELAKGDRVVVGRDGSSTGMPPEDTDAA